MLVQVLNKHGIRAKAVSKEAELGQLSPSAAAGVRMVVLSFIDPLSTLHLRHSVRLARRRFPGAIVTLGIWRERDALMGKQLTSVARCDVLAPTIGTALSATVAAALAERHADGTVRKIANA
jgi:hypothetical protein